LVRRVIIKKVKKDDEEIDEEIVQMVPKEEYDQYEKADR